MKLKRMDERYPPLLGVFGRGWTISQPVQDNPLQLEGICGRHHLRHPSSRGRGLPSSPTPPYMPIRYLGIDFYVNKRPIIHSPTTDDLDIVQSATLKPFQKLRCINILITPKFLYAASSILGSASKRPSKKPADVGKCPGISTFQEPIGLQEGQRHASAARRKGWSATFQEARRGGPLLSGAPHPITFPSKEEAAAIMDARRADPSAEPDNKDDPRAVTTGWQPVGSSSTTSERRRRKISWAVIRVWRLLGVLPCEAAGVIARLTAEEADDYECVKGCLLKK
ncbi:hypothetical protein HPB47_025978 [Ixodes persulcatus]|uniref:Uncharacterized protein n=1 Tax=Ixodes persulcatus TaxID=34615 RepID=A0AC60Q010_IXOPE|nr:hypothetical protein HPB47_025978 [Ixodes persulcatus]